MELYREIETTTGGRAKYSVCSCEFTVFMPILRENMQKDTSPHCPHHIFLLNEKGVAL
jgi:hypothetical protein